MGLESEAEPDRLMGLFGIYLISLSHGPQNLVLLEQSKNIHKFHYNSMSSLWTQEINQASKQNRGGHSVTNSSSIEGKCL